MKCERCDEDAEIEHDGIGLLCNSCSASQISKEDFIDKPIKVFQGGDAKLHSPQHISQCLEGGTSGGGGTSNRPHIIIPTNTKLGYDIAEEKKDGIRLQFEKSKTARARVVKGNSQALQAGGQIGVLDNMKIRRLTPTECERLQGFPDGWTEGFSDTQKYKMMGNAVTTKVIKAIGEKLI